MSIQLLRATSADVDAVAGLLQQVHLLTDDLPAGLPDFVIAKENNNYAGVAGLERYGPVALVRSVAVHPQYQGKQLGNKLVEYLLDKAQHTGIDVLYLITTSADQYFTRHGFQPVDRREVPSVIQQTRQFSQLCPASAIIMKRTVEKTEFNRPAATNE